jgi:acyl dehydratase
MAPYVNFSEMEVGDMLPSVEKDPVTKTQLVRYAGASGDFNPLHTDDAVAQNAGLKGVIAQGPLIMGFVGQAISSWVPKRYLKRFQVRFKGMTFPGDVISVSATLAEKTAERENLRILCHTEAKDQKGEIKLTGQFEVLCPVDKS